MPREAYLPCFEYDAAGLIRPTRRDVARWRPRRRCHCQWLLCTAFQMFKDLFDNHWVFDAGNDVHGCTNAVSAGIRKSGHLHRPAAVVARFDVDLA